MGLFALPGGSGADPVLTGAHSVPDFEQEIVDQYALAMAAAGLSDGHVRRTRSVVIEFARTLPGPLWEATCADAHAFLVEQRRLGHSVSTRAGLVGSDDPARAPAYCASSLYAAGMDIKALQELLGHQWLATTSGYIHVRAEHIEQAWNQSNQRLEDRFATSDRVGLNGGEG